MPAGLDSAAVLRALADHPDAFPAVRADVAEFARKAMTKQLKDKAMALTGLRRLVEAGGEEALATVLDGWTAADLASLTRKVDAYGSHRIPSQKSADRDGADEAAARRHLLDLAAGRREPAAKEETGKRKAAGRTAKAPQQAPAGPAAEKPPSDQLKSKIGGVLQSKVHSGAARPARARKSS